MAEKRKPYALIAEPDPARAARYVGFAVALGLEPNHARDGETAKTTLRTRGVPALLITELSLPRADGFELITELRAHASAEQTPAVVISGFLELRTRAWDEREVLGIAEVLSTNAPPETIFQAIKRALSLARTLKREVSGVGPEVSIDHARLAAIRPGVLLDETLPDEALQALAVELAAAFHAPLAMLWIREPRWWKAHAGDPGDPLGQLSAEDWRVAQSLGQRRGHAPELVPDAAVSPARMTHPLVKRGWVRSLALAPLLTSSGVEIGALCLMHARRIAFHQEHLDALVALGRRLSGELEGQDALRRNADERLRLEAAHEDATMTSLVELEAMLDELDSGILLLDEARNIMFANRALAEMLGCSLERIVGASFEQFNRDNARLFDDPSEYLQKIHILPHGPFVVREELELQRPVRRVVRWVIKPVQLSGGLGQLSVVTDITAEVDLATAKERLSRTDHLTNLANRTAAEEAIAREMARARRDSLPLALAMIDLDHFRRVNEALGNRVGDTVLQAIALLLEATLRGGDLAARWGGEEFLLLLPGVGAPGAHVVAERVRREVEALALAGVGPLTISIGIAEVDLDEPPAHAIARAAARLDFAKSEGRNCVR